MDLKINLCIFRKPCENSALKPITVGQGSGAGAFSNTHCNSAKIEASPCRQTASLKCMTKTTNYQSQECTPFDSV